jgi:hypothetical protein
MLIFCGLTFSFSLAQQTTEQQKQRHANILTMEDTDDLTKATLLVTAHPVNDVVFSTPATYCWSVILLLLIAPASLLANAVLICWDPNTDTDAKRAALQSLACASVAVAVTYLLVLPTRYEVCSNKQIRVYIMMPGMRYTFGHVVRAYPADQAKWYALKIKFATSISDCVAVDRSRGHWMLLVSPQHSSQFMQAVNDLSPSETDEILNVSQ